MWRSAPTMSSTTFSGVITGTGGLTKVGTEHLDPGWRQHLYRPHHGQRRRAGSRRRRQPRRQHQRSGPRLRPAARCPSHGTINGSVTINAGGNFQPGGGTIGTINVGSATFASGSTYTVETNAPGKPGATTPSPPSAITINSGATLAVTPDAPLTSYSPQHHQLHHPAGRPTASSRSTFSNITSTSAVFTCAYDRGLYPQCRHPDPAASRLARQTRQPRSTRPASARRSPATGNAIRTTPGAAKRCRGADRLQPACPGDIHASLRSAAVEDSRIIRDTVLDHLGKTSDSMMVWGAGFGGYGSISTDGNASGLHHDTAGFIAGADTPLDGGFRLGLAGAYTSNNASVTGKSSSASGNSGHVVAYGGWSDGMIDLKLGGDFAFGTAQVTRTWQPSPRPTPTVRPSAWPRSSAMPATKLRPAAPWSSPMSASPVSRRRPGPLRRPAAPPALSGGSRTDTQTYSTVGMPRLAGADVAG